MHSGIKYIIILFQLLGNSLYCQTPGDNIFSDENVHTIKIHFPQPNYFDSLIVNYQKLRQTRNSTYISCNVTINGTTINNTGIRIKGNSSFGHPGKKKSLKIDFDRFIEGQKFDGLKKINLNNGFLDPTMIREKLFLDILRKRGINAPRCSFAEVFFNQEYIGLYKIIEQIDKTYLKENFGNDDGNLFKGDPGGSLNWMGEDFQMYTERYELKTNQQENDWSDLIDLIRIINFSSDNNFKNELESVFNVESYLKTWAANNVFANLDSYLHNPHNYYIYYNEESDRFDWITWDVSVVFGVFPFWNAEETENIDVLYVPDSIPLILHKRLITVPEYYENYLSSICDFIHNDFTEENLFPEIDKFHTLIRPSVYKEQPSNKMFPNELFDENCEYQNFKMQMFEIPGLKRFITNRRKAILHDLDLLDWQCGSVAVEEAREDSYSIVYNSIEKSLEIALDVSPGATCRFTIYDLHGREIREINLSGLRTLLSLNDLVPGIYFYEISNEHSPSRGKLLIY